MSDPEPFFRQEALDHHVAPPGPGGVLDLERRWVRWLGRGLVAAVVAGAAAASTIRVDQRATGAAVVAGDGRAFRALLPAAVSGEVEPGTRLRLRVGGDHLTGRADEVETVDAARARDAGFDAGPGGHVLVSGHLEPGAGPTVQAGAAGRADILLGSSRLISVMFD